MPSHNYNSTVPSINVSHECSSFPPDDSSLRERPDYAQVAMALAQQADETGNPACWVPTPASAALLRPVPRLVGSRTSFAAPATTGPEVLA